MLRYELEKDKYAQLVFLEANVETGRPASDIKDIYDGPFYNWFSWDMNKADLDADELHEAHDLVQGTIDAQGPFDGVFGWSQGGTLAASYLIEHAQRQTDPAVKPPFRCAIFAATPRPIDPAGLLEDPMVMKVASADDLGEIIQMPTLHITGTQDHWTSECMLMKDLCDQARASTCTYEGVHRPPKGPIANSQMAAGIKQFISDIAAGKLK
jgi:pimeloyl-ACP methyl ester carboxylesterase